VAGLVVQRFRDSGLHPYPQGDSAVSVPCWQGEFHGDTLPEPEKRTGPTVAPPLTPLSDCPLYC
jgi:hypothetical protein